MFDKLRKKEGYQFDSVDLGRVVTTDGNERVIAQVDRKEDVAFVGSMIDKYQMTSDEAIRLLDIAWQCHGMIHVFAPHQMETVPSSRFVPEAHDENCTCNECGVQECKVILNAREEIFRSSAGGISYEAIVRYLGWTPETVLTVTWSKKGTNEHGEITRGESIVMQDGLIINAMNTSNA